MTRENLTPLQYKYQKALKDLYDETKGVGRLDIREFQIRHHTSNGFIKGAINHNFLRRIKPGLYEWIAGDPSFSMTNAILKDMFSDPAHGGYKRPQPKKGFEDRENRYQTALMDLFIKTQFGGRIIARDFVKKHRLRATTLNALENVKLIHRVQKGYYRWTGDGKPTKETVALLFREFDRLYQTKKAKEIDVHDPETLFTPLMKTEKEPEKRPDTTYKWNGKDTKDLMPLRGYSTFRIFGITFKINHYGK